MGFLVTYHCFTHVKRNGFETRRRKSPHEEFHEFWIQEIRGICEWTRCIFLDDKQTSIGSMDILAAFGEEEIQLSDSSGVEFWGVDWSKVDHLPSNLR